MSKILYPVGTSVQIRDWKIDQLRGNGHTYDHRKRMVAEYVKGSDKPYKLEGIDMTFAVNEIKSYRPGSSTVQNHRDTEDAPTTQAPVQNGLTACDVRNIIREELAAQAEVEAVYAEAEEELQNMIASLDEAEEEDTNMSADSQTIRQKLMYAAKPKEERVLTEAGILQGGVLTEQGRRVVLDYIWESDAELRKAVFKAVEKLNKKSKSRKNSDDDEE